MRHRTTRSLLLALGLSLLLPPRPAAGQKGEKADKPLPAAPAAKGSRSGAKGGGEPAPPAAAPVDVVRLSALKARGIGPAVMGGRVSDVALHPADPDTFYVGLATGGVFKTVNGGATFEPIFEKEAVASIGAVAVAPSVPRVVWVGTGEANDRNSSGFGNGVYRSTDGGDTFARAGLEGSRTVARIAVHPKDPATAYAAVPGDLWAPSKERGLFRTTDGGKSWKKVLAAAAPDDGDVGCHDVVLDPKSPDTLYAVLYARRRTPWSFTYGVSLTGGRDAGGIFRSTDGGATWKKLANGLPPKTGRIGIDLFRADPRVVMAVVQSDEGGPSDIDTLRSRKGGIFRSEDGGETWTRTNPLNPRAFYFSQVRIDPLDARRVYVLGYMLHVSDDGGKTFREDLFGKVHSDAHALAIGGGAWPPKGEEPKPKEGEAAEPAKPPVSRALVLGTDGGVYRSLEGGKNWIHLDRIAAGQFYRIGLDDSSPYRVCGGLQDNLNWVGPSRTYTKDGILNSDWTNVEGGDGFWCVFDPVDRNVVYAESQEGFVHRFDLRTGEVKELRPQVAEGQPRLRFHWNSPLVASLHEKGTLYLAGNKVFRLKEKGEHFEAISPDLSRNDPARTNATGSGAENYGVVYAFAESPLVAGRLWAGTDDGRLWLREAEGGAWTDRTASLPASVAGEWISRVEASAHDANVAYLAVDAHRSGRLAPLAFRTADAGRSWTSIAGNLPPDSPVHLVRESSKNPSLLFAGTETGLFVSLDRGGAWTRFGDLPTVAVDDILLHPRERDLVVATHGRSLYVVDDVSPLEALTPEVAAKEAHLFPPRPAFGRYLLPGWEESAGKGNFRGENPPEGAILTFWLKEAGGTVKVAVRGPNGEPVANLKPPALPGFGRVAWNLRPTKDLLSEYGGLGEKKLVPPGVYTVTLSWTPPGGGAPVTSKQSLKVTIAEGIETR